MHDTLRTTVLLSFQRALLGNVHHSLRGITVTWDHGTIYGIAYIDGPVTDEVRDAISLVETEVLADFPPEYEVKIDVIRLDAPSPLTSLKEWVYLRMEGEEWD